MQTQTHTNCLTVLWQNGGNHHTGQFGTLSATVAPFEEWEKRKKTPNLRYRIFPCYYTLAVLFLPFSSSTTFPGLKGNTQLQSWPRNPFIFLYDFALLSSVPRRTSYLVWYHTWILASLTKRSKGRCKKSAPPHKLVLGTSSFPQASGANTGGSALGNDSPNGAEKSRARIHIALFAPFKPGTCLSRTILYLFCTYWLLASLPRAISPPKI